MRAMALARMGDHRLPKRILSGKLEGAGKRARVSRQGKKMGGLCGRLYLNIPGQWRYENHLISRSTIGRGEDVTNSFPFGEGTARNKPLPGTYLTNLFVK